MAWPVRSAAARCAARCPCRSPWSCRRRGAGRSCRPRCARTARPNARARRPPRARCGRDIRWRPGRRASPSPSTVSYMCQRQSSCAHVAERGGDAALRRDRVRAGRKDLCDAGGLQPGLARAEHGAQPRAAGADHDHVVEVLGDRIGAAVHRRRARPPLAASRTSSAIISLRRRASGRRRSRPARRPRRRASSG